MSDKVTLSVIVSIVFLETVAIFHGINGQVLTAAIAGLTGIGGYKLAKGPPA